MRQILPLSILFCSSFVVQAQTLDELKVKKAELETARAEQQAEADAFNGEIASLASQIELLTGWKTGYSGMMGWDFNKSSRWAANPNPNSSATSLNLGFTGFFNRIQDKYFWNNKGIISKSWQDVDISDDEDDGLESTVDIVNISSLYGYKLTDKLAISVLGEVNTSMENFFDPGTLDIGTGITWTPVSDLFIVIHPFNYHVAFSGMEAVESKGSLGTKIRADYTKSVKIDGRSLTWSSTFTTYIPYASNEPTLFEYTWLNTFSYEIWKGMGLGFSFGIRKAEFETTDTQSFNSIGLAYTF